MNITSKWNGAYGQPGSSGANGKWTKTERGGTKGIARAMKAIKRAEAEERNSKTAPERRRSHARSLGHDRCTDLERALEKAAQTLADNINGKNASVSQTRRRVRSRKPTP